MFQCPAKCLRSAILRVAVFPIVFLLLAVQQGFAFEVNSGSYQKGHHSRTTKSDPPLQQRVEALGQAIALRCGNDPSKLQAAKENLLQTLKAWNQLEDRTEQNKEQLRSWLSLSMRVMMLGRSGKMPEPLAFVMRKTVDNPVIEIVQNDRIQPASTKRAIQKVIESSDQSNEEPLKRRVAKPMYEGPERSRWSRHPSSAPLEWKDPFENKTSSQVPLIDPFEKKERIEREVRKPFIEQVPSKGEPVISINHSELMAAIRGFNLEVRNVNRRLQHVDRLNANHLLKIADDLERLWSEREFLKLYLDGLTEDVRRILPRPLSAKLAQELVIRQVEDLLASGSLNNKAERSALQVLNQKLASYK